MSTPSKSLQAEIARNELFAKGNILRAFVKGKNGRSVPAGHARKETWQTLMKANNTTTNTMVQGWKGIHREGPYLGTFRESEGCSIPE